MAKCVDSITVGWRLKPPCMFSGDILSITLGYIHIFYYFFLCYTFVWVFMLSHTPDVIIPKDVRMFMALHDLEFCTFRHSYQEVGVWQS